MSLSLKNHVAVVTGSSTGLGKAIAFVLGKAGAKVLVNYFNNEARAQKTLAELEQAKVGGHPGQGATAPNARCARSPSPGRSRRFTSLRGCDTHERV